MLHRLQHDLDVMVDQRPRLAAMGIGCQISSPTSHDGTRWKRFSPINMLATTGGANDKSLACDPIEPPDERPVFDLTVVERTVANPPLTGFLPIGSHGDRRHSTHPCRSDRLFRHPIADEDIDGHLAALVAVGPMNGLIDE